MARFQRLVVLASPTWPVGPGYYILAPSAQYAISMIKGVRYVVTLTVGLMPSPALCGYSLDGFTLRAGARLSASFSRRLIQRFSLSVCSIISWSIQTAS